MSHSRILGALLGVHAGDSLGATVEFSSWATIRRQYPAGLRDIVGGGPFPLASRPRHGRHRPDTRCFAGSAGQHMLDWYDGHHWPDPMRSPGQPPADIGGATSTGLDQFRECRDEPKRWGAGRDQAGNGSLMRCIPTALWGADESEHESENKNENKNENWIAETALISALTHNDGRCILACIVYNAIVRGLVAGQTPAVALDEAEKIILQLPTTTTTFNIVAAHLGPDCVLAEDVAAVQTALQKARRLDLAAMAQDGPTRHDLPGLASGYVLESLMLGVAAVLDDRRSLVDVLVDVVRIGCDTDTNGAIAGGLLGARDGVEAIPAVWRDQLQFADEFSDCVNTMNGIRGRNLEAPKS